MCLSMCVIHAQNHTPSCPLLSLCETLVWGKALPVEGFDATPPAALDADQPKILCWLLVRPSLALPAPYLPAHTSGTTAPALFDKPVIDVGAIFQDHIPDGALVLSRPCVCSVTSFP
jgi:hypothetical protein